MTVEGPLVLKGAPSTLVAEVSRVCVHATLDLGDSTNPEIVCCMYKVNCGNKNTLCVASDPLGGCPGEKALRAQVSQIVLRHLAHRP